MRVITGSAKGRPLKAIKGREIRPTSDRVKESLFSVLGARVAGASFLDLFAGSGGVGIEALSRGAASCLFVELITAHMRVLEENLTATGLRERAQILRRDARAAALDLGRRGLAFDLIFVDPPYGQNLVEAALEAIVSQRLLRPGGWVVCERDRRDPVPEAVPGAADAGGLLRFREITFGDTVLSFYQENAGPDGRQAD